MGPDSAFSSPPSVSLSVSSSSSSSAVEDFDEGLAELDVERGVDDRVDGAVEIAQPGEGAVQGGRDAAAAAVGLQHMGQEEGQPADDEHS